MASAIRGKQEKEKEKKEEISKARITAIYVSTILLIILASIALQNYASSRSSTPLKQCQNMALATAKYSCLESLAVSTKNASICTQLPAPYYEQCYYSLAVNTTSPSICQNISNASMESSCITEIALKNNSASLCKQAIEKNMCIDAIALKQENASLCNGISNSTNMSICSSAVYLAKAIRYKNADYCNNVSQSNNTQIAGQIISSVNSSEITNASLELYASSLATGMQYNAREFCILSVADISKNQSACSMLTGQLANFCITMSMQQPSSSLTKINYTSELKNCTAMGQYEQMCITGIKISQAVNERNASICGTLPVNSSSACYEAVAKSENNVSICKEITNTTLANACVMDLTLNVTNVTG